MLRLGRSQRCRHRALVAHFEERIEACGTACDICTGRDVLAEAPRAARRPRARKEVRGPSAPAAVRAQAPRTGEKALFLELKALRKRLADERNLPAYLVFSDATLQHMAHVPSRHGPAPAGHQRRGAQEAGDVRRGVPGSAAGPD